MSRYREHRDLLAELARDAQTILDRHDAEARDHADRLMIEARLEAARLLTDARRELEALNKQIAALQQAQRDAALTLQQTRRALDTALGHVPADHAGGADLGRSRHGDAAVQKSAKPRGAIGYILPIAAGATATLAVAAAIWFLNPHFKTAVRRGGASDLARATAVGTPPAAGAPATAADSQPVAFRITLHAKRPSWVRAVRDGTGEPGGLLKSGERRVITVSRQASVRVGDAGAVLVSVNGGVAEPFGRDGQPATRVFGVRTSTPPPSSPVRPPLAAAAIAPKSSTDSSATPSATPVTSTTGSLPVEKDDIAVTHASSGSVQTEILETDRQWFESYYRGDRGSMSRLSAPGFELVDSRAAADRLASRSAPPVRMLQDVRIDVHGDGAVLSGRMIERSADGNAHSASFVSEVWVKRDGAWRLLGVRLASDSQVRQAAGSLR
jgi:hypothetical protein